MVVGIIASLIVPNLIVNYSKQKNLSILKKAYSDINNALKLFDVEYNCGGNLQSCASGYDRFFNQFTYFLYAKQGYGTPIDKESQYTTYFAIESDKQEKLYGYTHINAFNPLLADPNCQTCEHCQGFHGFLLSSKGGEYYILIAPNMGDNSYFLNGYNPARNSKYGYLRARILILTNPKHLAKCVGISCDKKTTIGGLEKFELFITDSEHLIPNGSPLCGPNSYFCRPLTEDNCSSKTKEFRYCLQKVIQDGWQIKYL